MATLNITWQAIILNEKQNFIPGLRPSRLPVTEVRGGRTQLWTGMPVENILAAYALTSLMLPGGDIRFARPADAFSPLMEKAYLDGSSVIFGFELSVSSWAASTVRFTVKAGSIDYYKARAESFTAQNGSAAPLGGYEIIGFPYTAADVLVRIAQSTAKTPAAAAAGFTAY